MRTCGTDLQLCPRLIRACGADLQLCSQLNTVDWDAAWLDPWRGAGRAVAGHTQAGLDCASALNAVAAQHNGLQAMGLQFVPQTALPAGEAYEAFIFRARQVPTRDGLHDFFNGLCWLQFPATKTKLNQLQAAQIAASGIQPVRGPARDALTIFDENAAFFQGPDALWDALVAKDWQTLFVAHRPLWAQAQLVLFGHALLEKLVSPRKPITAHVYRAQAASNSIAEMDKWMATDISAEKLARKPFAHLPVLGVPGWCVSNEDPDFYTDATVFRPARQAPVHHPGLAPSPGRKNRPSPHGI